MKRTNPARIILLFSFILGCGKSGDPTPPVPIIPKAVSDLAATQQGTTIVVSWSYPSLTAAGQRLRELRRILVFRYIEELPASLMGRDPRTLADVPAGTPDEVALFSQIRPLAPAQFVKLRETLAVIEDDELAGMTEGARLLFKDNPPLRAADGRPVRVTYGVVAEAEERSEMSNLAVVVPLDVPRAPRDLEAEVTADAVTLKWKPPEVTLTGEGMPSIVGYNVYRFAGGDAPPTDLGASVNASPIAETTFRDAPPYTTYRYAVTAVRSVGPPLLQSVTSNAVSVEFKDLLAPPVPASLTALAEESTIRLIWEPVDAPDLAGYKVYRQENGNRVVLTRELITESVFRDERVAANIAYSYRVTSVDKLGNESAPATAENVVIRR